MNFKNQNSKTMQLKTGMEQLFRMKISMCLLTIFLLLGATSCQKDTLLVPKVQQELQATFESDNDDSSESGTNKMGGEGDDAESGNTGDDEGEGDGDEGEGEGGDEGPVTDKNGCDCDNDDEEGGVTDKDGDDNDDDDDDDEEGDEQPPSGGGGGDDDDEDPEDGGGE